VVVEIEIPFLGALLACFLRECDQEVLRIQMYSEEFSATPDGKIHDRHSTPPKLHVVKRTGSQIVRRCLEDWLTAGVVTVSSILLLKSLDGLGGGIIGS